MALLATFRREPVVAVVAREAENQKLIKNTAFEELAKKIDEEDIQPRNIFKEIMAVYFLMRIKMGMRHRPITISEFEIVNQNNKPSYEIDIWGNFNTAGVAVSSGLSSGSTWNNFDPISNF